LAAPTSSSRSTGANHRASFAALLGLLALLAVPAGVALARQSGTVDLLDAAFAIPAAVLLGLAAFAFGRGARARIDWTIGRAGGRARLRIARILAALGISVALAAAVAVGVYELLTYLEHSR
jgi:hypothetical protein